MSDPVAKQRSSEAGAGDSTVAASVTNVMVSFSTLAVVPPPRPRPASSQLPRPPVALTAVCAFRQCVPAQSSIQSTTMTGVMAVGSSLGQSIVDITPHLAGAIDAIAVRQPDGSLKCSPLYGAHSSQQAPVSTA